MSAHPQFYSFSMFPANPTMEMFKSRPKSQLSCQVSSLSCPTDIPKEKCTYFLSKTDKWNPVFVKMDAKVMEKQPLFKTLNLFSFLLLFSQKWISYLNVLKWLNLDKKQFPRDLGG